MPNLILITLLTYPMIFKVSNVWAFGRLHAGRKASERLKKALLDHAL